MILVTGASGFVGRALCAELVKRQYEVCGAVRGISCSQGLPCKLTPVGSIGPATDWFVALKGAEVVVHLAARVHVMRDEAADPLAEFRSVNVDGTLNLAIQAAEAKVRRFIYLSSIKVNGELTRLGHAFTAEDTPDPQDPYSISKNEAEQGLRKLAAETEMDIVIIRPPLIYGPGVKANFLSMMQWLKRGVPLPLGAIQNKRSLLALDNLVDLIITCLSHPAAKNQIFLAADGEDLSTTELLRRMGIALGTPAHLIPVPVWLLETIGILMAKRDMVQRLCGSLQVETTKTLKLLGWRPPLNVDEGLSRVAIRFLNETTV